MRKDDYNADGYLEGVEVVSMDWYAVGSADNRRLFDQYRLVPDVVFVLDPPYLSTDCGTYTKTDYWRLSDWRAVGSADNLDVLKCLQGTKFVYFTSSKSTIVELAEWIARNDFHGNPFEGAKVYRHHVGGIVLNYEDVMLVKAA